MEVENRKFGIGVVNRRLVRSQVLDANRAGAVCGDAAEYSITADIYNSVNQESRRYRA